MPENILRLIDYENNASLWTPKEMLSEIEDISCDGALIILVNQNSGHFGVRWQQAQLKLTECIAAMELLKTEMIELIRGKD